jgi:gliding motility-associated protein GldC
MEKEIKFAIGLDEKNIPEKIHWRATDTQDKLNECRAILISIWDHNQKGTLSFDLWTKDMTIEEMNLLFTQTLFVMADTYDRATQNHELTEELKTFAKSFGEKNKAIAKK